MAEEIGLADDSGEQPAINKGRPVEPPPAVESDIKLADDDEPGDMQAGAHVPAAKSRQAVAPVSAKPAPAFTARPETIVEDALKRAGVEYREIKLAGDEPNFAMDEGLAQSRAYKVRLPSKMKAEDAKEAVRKLAEQLGIADPAGKGIKREAAAYKLTLSEDAMRKYLEAAAYEKIDEMLKDPDQLKKAAATERTVAIPATEEKKGFLGFGKKAGKPATYNDTERVGFEHIDVTPKEGGGFEITGITDLASASGFVDPATGQPVPIEVQGKFSIILPEKLVEHLTRHPRPPVTINYDIDGPAHDDPNAEKLQALFRQKLNEHIDVSAPTHGDAPAEIFIASIPARDVAEAGGKLHAAGFSDEQGLKLLPVSEQTSGRQIVSAEVMKALAGNGRFNPPTAGEWIKAVHKQAGFKHARFQMRLADGSTADLPPEANLADIGGDVVVDRIHAKASRDHLVGTENKDKVARQTVFKIAIRDSKVADALKGLTETSADRDTQADSGGIPVPEQRTPASRIVADGPTALADRVEGAADTSRTVGL